MPPNQPRQRGRTSRVFAAAVTLLVALVAGLVITDQVPDQATAPVTAQTTTATTSAAASLFASPAARTLRTGVTTYPRIGCKRPNVPPKDAKALADVAEPLRSYLHTAIIDARAEGLSLYLVSGGRSDGQQWDLRHDRVPHGHECDPAYKGNPRTAIPGRSNHRNLSPTIAAADMGGALAWLHRHADDYGIHFPVPGENWHAEITGRTPLRPIIPFNAPVARWLPIRAGDTNATIIARGGLANEVTEVQLILARLGFQPGAVDGRYGPGSQAAMTRFKQQIIRLQRATGQPVWPNADPYVGPKTIAMLRWWNR